LASAIEEDKNKKKIKNHDKNHVTITSIAVTCLNKIKEKSTKKQYI